MPQLLGTGLVPSSAPVAPDSISVQQNSAASPNLLTAYALNAATVPPATEGDSWEWQTSTNAGSTWGASTYVGDAFPYSLASGTVRFRARLNGQNGTTTGWVSSADVTYAAPASGGTGGGGSAGSAAWNVSGGTSQSDGSIALANGFSLGTTSLTLTQGKCLTISAVLRKNAAGDNFGVVLGTSSTNSYLFNLNGSGGTSCMVVYAFGGGNPYYLSSNSPISDTLGHLIKITVTPRTSTLGGNLIVVTLENGAYNCFVDTNINLLTNPVKLGTYASSAGGGYIFDQRYLLGPI